MAWFSNKVSVTFIDNSTGKVIGVTEMLPADLPESFQPATTLHIGEVDWSVVQAIPDNRSDYSKAKKLTLRLARIERIDPSKILFSLPSICDEIPALGVSLLSGNEYVLHEDDWRQFELVSREFAAEVDAEIQSIRQIHEQQATGAGWRSIHVRRHPGEPIAGRISLQDVERIFGICNAFCGVTYFRANAQIESGYSFTASDGQQFYGLVPDGIVTIFGIAQKALSALPTHSIEAVEAFAREFDLDLVQWCRCVRVGNHDPLFLKVLEENASR